MQKMILGMFFVLALAGCTSSDDTVDPTKFVDKDEFKLDGNLGAIAGLFVDDLFRPIQLGATAESQYQDVGFILIQQTAHQIETNENGEFTVINLEPGQYTLRVQAEKHEASAQSVTVVAGEFAEVTIQARRLIEESSTIITEEQTMFAACPVEALVVGHAAPPCTLDLSGDGGRVDFISNYSTYMGEATYIITEATFNQEGTYEVQVRRLDPLTGGVDAIDYGGCTVTGAYLRMQMVPGEIHAQEGCDEQTNEFDISQEYQTIMFAWSETHDTVGGLPTDDTRPLLGVGVKIGVRAQVIQSIFLGEPEVDIDNYCVLCD